MINYVDARIVYRTKKWVVAYFENSLFNASLALVFNVR